MKIDPTANLVLETVGIHDNITCATSIKANASPVWWRIRQKLGAVSRLILLSMLAVVAAPQAAVAGFVNGGFEADLTGWNVLHSDNPGTIPTFPPTTEANLGLVTPGVNAWSGTVFTDAVGAGSDTNTGNAVTFPLYGSKVARVNYGGNSNRASSIDQTQSMTLADVDPADGKVHVRFAIAPVLANPGHSVDEQPYFFVEVTNVTKGTQLYHTFNFSGQSGVPWVTVGGYQYTNWQAIDIAPGAGVLDVGDQVKVKIIASGCGAGGHEGHIYVDSGPALTTLPGPYVYATAPQWVAAGGTVTYTYTYGNSGTSPLTNTLVTVVSPQDSTSTTPKNLTFASISGAGTGSCTVPAVGTAAIQGVNPITCNFGTYNPNNVGTFQVTFNVPAVTTGPINHGNYKVAGDNSPAILGPLVQSNLSGATPLVDLGVTISDGQSSVTWGQALTYTIVVSNTGPAAVPAGAKVVAALPTQLVNATWTCAGSGGASCPNASGSGAISETTAATIPSGSTLTYTVTAQADPAGSGTGTINYAVTATAPGGVLDSSSANNTAADVDNVGPALSTLTVSKSGAGSGTVSTVPGGINCNAACPTANADYPTGTDVVLYASAPAGSIFVGWSGGGCSGTASSCTLTLNNSVGVTAVFAVPVIITPMVGANGTVSPAVAQPVAVGGSTSFTVKPSAGYAMQVTDTCASGGGAIGGSLVGTTYTTNAIAQDCDIKFSFTNVGVATVTPSITGGNGSYSPNTALTVAIGGTASYVVTPNSGYAAVATLGGSCVAGSWSGNTYTTGTVATDCTVIFSFVAGYTVAGSVISGSGSITPASRNVASGGNAVFTITPSLGYAAVIDASSTCTGGSLVGTTYTQTNVLANCTVVAKFVAINYTVSGSTTGGTGTITPASTTATYGGSAVFTITPGTGYTAAIAASSTCPAGNWVGVTYTVPNVVADCAVVAIFSLVPPTPVPDTTSSVAGTAGTFNVATNDNSPPSGSTYSQTATTCSPAGTVSPVGVASFTTPATIGATCTVTYQVCNPAPDSAICASSILTVTASAPAPDMSISLAGLPATATVGGAYTGAFSCTNLGGVASGGTSCTVSGLPAGVSIGACTISPSNAVWVAGNAVPAGQTVTCAVAGTPTTVGPLAASGSTGATGDNNSGNNSTTRNITMAAVVMTPTSVPTLSEYMMVVLSGLLLMFGFGALRRRENKR